MDASAISSRDAGSVTQGLLAMWVAVASFSIADAIAKWHGQEGFASVQIVFFRYLFGLIPVAVALYVSGLHQIRTARPGAHVLRGVLMSAALALFFWGLNFVPLAEAIAVAPPDVAAVAAEVSDHRAITSPDPAGPDQILISHSSSTAFF